MFSALLKIVQFEVKGQPVIINFFNTNVIFTFIIGVSLQKTLEIISHFLYIVLQLSIAQQQQTLHVNSLVLYNILWTYFSENLCSKSLHSGYL